MKKASGKSNLSIIKDYVDGNRPFTQVSFSGADELVNRKEGEEWEDSQGKKWKKQHGKKVNINNIKTTILDATKDMHVCKICGTDTRFSSKIMARYDNQVIFKTGKCYDCFVEFETSLKMKGLYQTFLRHRDLSNLKGYLIDFKAKLKDTIDWCNSSSAKKIESFEELGPESVGLQVEYDNTDRIDVIKNDALKDLKLVNDRLKDIKNELPKLKLDIKSVKEIEKRLINKYKNGRTNMFTGVRLVNITNK
jgi:hypothetical protein